MTWTVTWLVIAIAATVIEFLTFGLTSIWLTGGALVALVLNLLHCPVYAQVAAFFIVSFVLVLITRPLVNKYMSKKKTLTNYEEAIGKEIRVTEDIDNTRNTGRAIYNGLDWAARSWDDAITFEKDEMARVVKVEGVKLILEKIQ